MRPIFVAGLSDGTWRKLGDDCGGRPREWVDERRLIIERFARLNSIALIDTDTGDQQELLQSAERSLSNPRLSPDRRWIAFDASRRGEPATVFVAPFQAQLIPESEWMVVDRSRAIPSGRRTGGSCITRPPARIRWFVAPFVRGTSTPLAGLAEGESIAVYASTEMLMPAYLPGTAPIATSDQIILVLGDFRGDVWLMDLEPH